MTDQGVKKLDDYPDIMTLENVMEYMQLKKTKVYDLLNSGELKGTKMGHLWRISKENLIIYCKSVGLFS